MHDFFRFFIIKIRTIKDTINSKVSSFLHPTNIPDLPFNDTPLDTFLSVIPSEVLKLINKSSNVSSSIDFIPTSLIKSCSTVFSEIISNLANLSITQGTFPLKLKLAQVTPLLRNLVLKRTLLATIILYQTSTIYPSYLCILYYDVFNTIQHLPAISTLSNQHIGAIISLNRLSCWPWTLSTTLLTRALLLALDTIYHDIDEGSSTVLISFDLHAAFDSIDHTILFRGL